jgi:hypothetical protein
MFCAPRLVFGSTEGVGSRFRVLRTRTCFWRCGGRQVPFSCFALSDTFSAVTRVSQPVFMFCTPGLVFGGTEAASSYFDVLCSLTRFRRYGGCCVPFPCSARLDSFSAVPRASGPVFIFCALGLFFGGTEGVGSRFNVLCAKIHFQR